MACRTLFILSLILGTGLIVACNNSNNDSPVGSDDTKISNPLQDSSLIDKTIQTMMDNDPIPGMSVSIISNSKNSIIWSKGYGVKNIETASPVTENTSFWLGSVSKAVMGTAIMIAQEKGFLSLDDDVRILVSTHGGFRINNPDSHTITLKHLTTHTSGIIDNDSKYDCAYFVNNGDGTQTKLVNLFDVGITCPEDGPTTLPGFLVAYLDSAGAYYDSEENFSTVAPGEKFDYSNIGAGLAGYSLELATGQTLAEFATDNIFTPP